MSAFCACPIGTNRLWRNVRGKMIPSTEGVAWKAEAAWAARRAGMRPLPGPVAVEITLHPRLTAKGKPSLTRLDLDAPIKPLLDALNGVAYGDDKQVVSIRATLGDAIPGGGLSFSVFDASQ